MKLLLAVLALISAGPAAADCPKAADWARAFYSEHYFFYAGAPDPILQFTTPEFGTLLKKEWAYSKGEAQARTRVLAPSRFHHSARRIAVICVLSCAALNENKNVHSRVARDHCALSCMLAQENYRGGIVHGPKAAFNISAPEGWVLDNESGVSQGMPCVLYPKGSSWSDAKTVMYAKIASTQYEDVDKFVAIAIKEMKDRRGLPKEKIESENTRDGRSYFINEYPATQDYSQWERVAYIQLPHAVAYIVLSSRDKSSYRKDARALTEVLKTFGYLKPKSDSSRH